MHVETTEMWDPWNLDDPKHKNTFDHPKTYSFVDISQNNHQKGQRHWNNAQKQRKRIKDNPRPLNNVKIYGSDEYGHFGNDRDGIERFWRNILGGLASSRFHRPPGGIGLNPKAQANLRSMRSVLDRIDPFRCEPHNELLEERENNEAYCFANPSLEYVIYFPRKGEVKLRLPDGDGPWNVQWLDNLNSKWKAKERIQGAEVITLSCPGNHRVALVTTGSE